MAVYVNTFFEERLEDLFALAKRVDTVFAFAALDYRVVGGLATYLYVENAVPDAGRLTRDVDIVVNREDVERIAAAAESFGLHYRDVAGVDMLLQGEDPKARRAVRLLFSGEKVRPEYTEPVPPLGEPTRLMGMRLIPIADLVRMKLTSFRLKDQTHLKDLDQAGVITAEVEAGLTDLLRERLAYIRAHD